MDILTELSLPVNLLRIFAGRGGGDLGAQGLFIRLDVFLLQDLFLCAPEGRLLSRGKY
jgi:hypothetical protein